VVEDVTDIILNLKEVVCVMDDKTYTDASTRGPGPGHGRRHPGSDRV
jgi:DNA-directed RNA polymerase alpha subunit